MAVVALVIGVAAGHLGVLPATLEDIDSVNFALGVRDFDPARHRPHPPGYPVYIALGKAATAVTRAAWPAGLPDRVEARALAALSLVAALALIWLVPRVADGAVGGRRQPHRPSRDLAPRPSGHAGLRGLSAHVVPDLAADERRARAGRGRRRACLSGAGLVAAASDARRANAGSNRPR